MTHKRDQRLHSRCKIELPVAVGDANNPVAGTICFDTQDLSLGGAFLRSELLLEVDEQLELSFDLPNGTRISTVGRVVHVVRDTGANSIPGMGIAFANFSERDLEAVRALLTRG